MSTQSYAFGQNGTRTADQSSGTSGTTFWVYAHTTVSNIKVSAAQKNTEQDAFVTMILTTGDGITTQETKQISGGRSDCSFNSTLSVNKDTWFNITFWTNNSVVYWDDVAVTEYISTGWTGNTASPSSIYPYSCKFTLTYDPLWIINSGNDEYPYPAGSEPFEWQGFEKDEFGYPRNWSAWKLDSSNESYPWPTGYEDAIIRGLPVKIKNANGAWAPVLTKIFTESSLNNVYIKLMEGVEPNENNTNVINSE